MEKLTDIQFVALVLLGIVLFIVIGYGIGKLFSGKTPKL